MALASRDLLAFTLVLLYTGSCAARCFYLTNMVIVGGTYDEFDASDVRQCCIRCAQHQCCMAYTYDKLQQRCYMKSAISHSEERPAFTSGVKANYDNGNMCKLPNIEIIGGTVTYPLKNAEECSQYCTAYGIYTWQPRGIEENSQPTCTCTNRITSIRYNFGAMSSIFTTADTNA